MESISGLAGFVGVTLPLMTLAGSGLAYVIKYFSDSSDNRRQKFFDMMQYIDSDRSLATKMASIYMLRSFPEHGEFIYRFCREAENNIEGNAADSLRSELRQTAEYFDMIEPGRRSSRWIRLIEYIRSGSKRERI